MNQICALTPKSIMCPYLQPHRPKRTRQYASPVTRSGHSPCTICTCIQCIQPHPLYMQPHPSSFNPISMCCLSMGTFIAPKLSRAPFLRTYDGLAHVILIAPYASGRVHEMFFRADQRGLGHRPERTCNINRHLHTFWGIQKWKFCPHPTGHYYAEMRRRVRYHSIVALADAQLQNQCIWSRPSTHNTLCNIQEKHHFRPRKLSRTLEAPLLVPNSQDRPADVLVLVQLDPSPTAAPPMHPTAYDITVHYPCIRAIIRQAAKKVAGVAEKAQIGKRCALDPTMPYWFPLKASGPLPQLL